jgi:hypothetical protein
MSDDRSTEAIMRLLDEQSGDLAGIPLAGCGKLAADE